MVKAILYDSWYPGTPEGGQQGGGGAIPPLPLVFGRSVKHLSTRVEGEHINMCAPEFTYLPTSLHISPLGY